MAVKAQKTSADGCIGPATRSIHQYFGKCSMYQQAFVTLAGSREPCIVPEALIESCRDRSVGKCRAEIKIQGDENNFFLFAPLSRLIRLPDLTLQQLQPGCNSILLKPPAQMGQPPTLISHLKATVHSGLGIVQTLKGVSERVV